MKWATLGLLLLAACVETTSGGDAGQRDAGSSSADAGPPPSLSVWAPVESGPPGVWLDAVVSASGALGTGDWVLSVEGLPAMASARFEPATLSATHGAVLRLDVSPAAPQGTFILTVVASSGSQRLEAIQPVVVIERNDVTPEFVVQVRQPLAIGPTGAIELALTGDAVDFPAQVVSIGGFSGAAQLLVQDPNGTMKVSPSSVMVNPGVPAAATVTVRATDEAPGALVAAHRRAWRGQSGLTFGTSALTPTPGFNVLPVRRSWVSPGGSTSSALAVHAWGLGSVSFSMAPVTTADVSASAGVFSFGGATLAFTAVANATAGARDVMLTVNGGGQQQQRAARVVVLGATTALAATEVLAPSLQRDAGAPTTATELDILIDGAGLEVGRLEQGWFRSREANGFTPELLGMVRPAAQIPGVQGGRATATAQGVSVGVTEVRGDVGTRSWTVPGDAQSRVALAYDASNRLWCAATVAPGVLRLWRTDVASSPTAVPMEFSAGLPTQAIAAGPWLAAGAGVPTVAFVKDGQTHVAQFSGTQWVELTSPVLTADATLLDAALVMDPLGQPVFAWVEDGALHVKRLEGGAWVELGALPSGAMPRELALLIDRGAPVLLWSEALYEPPPQARLDGLSSHVWFSRFESGSWRTPVDVQFDAQADARSLVMAQGADGKVVLGWTEDRVVVLLRGSP